LTRDHSFGGGSGERESSWQVASGRVVERRPGRERRRVRSDGLLREAARTSSLPGESGGGLGNQGHGRSAQERQPQVGKGPKGRDGSPPRWSGRPQLRLWRTGTAVRTNGHFGGQDAETVRRRSGELEPEPVLRGWERDFVEGGCFGSCSLRSRPGAF
jgi:hypothetical protein